MLDLGCATGSFLAEATKIFQVLVGLPGRADTLGTFQDTEVQAHALSAMGDRLVDRGPRRARSEREVPVERGSGPRGDGDPRAGSRRGRSRSAR